MNIYVTKNMWTANNYVKKYLLSYIIRGFQIKTIFKYLCVPTEWLKNRKQNKTKLKTPIPGRMWNNRNSQPLPEEIEII